MRIKAGVNAMDGKNVLITGGGGYIGSVLVDSAPKHWRITVLDNCLMAPRVSGVHPEPARWMSLGPPQSWPLPAVVLRS